MDDIVIDLDELPPTTTSAPAPPSAAPQATSQTSTQVENVPAAPTPAAAVQNTAVPAEKKKPGPKPKAAQQPTVAAEPKVEEPKILAHAPKPDDQSSEERIFADAFAVIGHIIYRNLIKK